MRCYYDFHIHSCLSPCGDSDMTPNNIVNMALLKGLDAIAVTDHNCCVNLPAVLKCAENRLVVICGMEIESCEEVHMVSLFPTYDMCKRMEAKVREAANPVKNDAQIFGEQIIMNEEDEQIGTVENLLVVATNLSVYDIAEFTHECGGVCIAAHVDKSSYSILSNLGFLPDDLQVDCIEISKNTTYEDFIRNNTYLSEYKALFSSDAHYLTDISEKVNFIETEVLTAHEIISSLRKK